MDVPKAKARFGFRNRIVVDNCPFCHKTHYHSIGSSDDDFTRMPDCFKGKYLLTFERPKNVYVLGEEQSGDY